MAKRHPLAREEIGLLMSFAKTPEAFTADAISQLEAGLTSEQLLDFFAKAGLPASTAAAMIAPEPGEAADLPWSSRSVAYRRATVVTIAAPAVIVTLINIAGGQPIERIVVMAGLLGGGGYLLYRLIVWITP